ncbi:MAG: double-strand break repair protein AddB [Rhodospirillaceae bacterium]|nr:double-strand break repair protein AddB [Rhodospirillaceae bacterium]
MKVFEINPNQSKNWLSQSLQKNKKIWTIPSTEGFTASLVDGLLADTKGDPLALANILVLLPTRRAARSLESEFLTKNNNKVVLLPKFLALGELDDDTNIFENMDPNNLTLPNVFPPIDPLKRQLMLTQLVYKQAQEKGEVQSIEQAIALASELAQLIDEVQTEGLDFKNLTNLVPDNLAEHWQITVAFLDLITEYWPQILKEEKMSDPSSYRNLMFEKLGKDWSTRPPEEIIIAAGSTGSVPATRALLKIVSKMPKGCIVLPGLDQNIADDDWEAIDDSHPQNALKLLLNDFNIRRHDVLTWPVKKMGKQGEMQQTLITEVMRTTDTSHKWNTVFKSDERYGNYITRIEAQSPREEAAAIAMALRWVVEDKNKGSGILVTPDRNLARRVSSELKRWDIKVNDSAGEPLSSTPQGVFLLLIAEMIVDKLSPVALLSLLKHPLSSGQINTTEFEVFTRHLELTLLRGPRPPHGTNGLCSAIKISKFKTPALEIWTKSLMSILQPLEEEMNKKTVNCQHLIRLHLKTAENMASTDILAGKERLWSGDIGKDLGSFMVNLITESQHLCDINPSQYPKLLKKILDGKTFRPRYNTHPQISILSPLEARLLSPTITILGGMNEGTWPMVPETGPWMSRPMREQFGLPQPERRIGQAAHDVAQLLGAERVILTRSIKVDGTPTVASRWWQRLNQIIEPSSNTDNEMSQPWIEWSNRLTRPDTVVPCQSPKPVPPLNARPRALPVTAIETWMRNPYNIYAKYILKLKKLEPIDAEANSSDYGVIVHKILEEFIQAYPTKPPKNIEEKLIQISIGFLKKNYFPPSLIAFWTSRFEQIANWLAEQEPKQREEVIKIFAEIEGSLTINSINGPFVITAKADRIESLKNGAISIIDYKTGTPPGKKEVSAGNAPQLPLEALIASKGIFKGITSTDVVKLSYWHLKGKKNQNQIKAIASGEGEVNRLVETVEEILLTLVKSFDDQSTTYLARSHPEEKERYSDYDHLSRIKEWSIKASDEHE